MQKNSKRPRTAFLNINKNLNTGREAQFKMNKNANKLIFAIRNQLELPLNISLKFNPNNLNAELESKDFLHV